MLGGRLHTAPHLNSSHTSGNIFSNPFPIGRVVSVEYLGNTGNLCCLRPVARIPLEQNHGTWGTQGSELMVKVADGVK